MLPMEYLMLCRTAFEGQCALIAFITFRGHFWIGSGGDPVSNRNPVPVLQVVTRWRMYGELNLWWRPRLDVVGRTRFTYDPAAGNRIRRYDEVWEVSAADALRQLLTRG